MPNTYYVPYLLLASIGLPLAIQDIRSLSVERILLLTAVGLWIFSNTSDPDNTVRMMTVVLVSFAGAVLLNAMPDRLGEADVIFICGMAAVFPFRLFVLAVLLGCIACCVCFVWLARGGRDEAYALPLPFLPSLYWGGITVILGGLRL